MRHGYPDIEVPFVRPWLRWVMVRWLDDRRGPVFHVLPLVMN